MVGVKSLVAIFVLGALALAVIGFATAIASHPAYPVEKFDGKVVCHPTTITYRWVSPNFGTYTQKYRGHRVCERR